MEGDSVYLEMNVEKDMLSIPTEIIDTENWEWSALWKRRLTILMEIRLYWIRIILENQKSRLSGRTAGGAEGRLQPG